MPDKRYIGRLVRDIRSLSLPHDQASEWLTILWYPSRAAARFASVDVDHQPDCPGVRPEYRYVSVRVMKHAAELDLVAYENPEFYDRMERARVQATDRLGMIQSIGRLVQQVITG